MTKSAKVGSVICDELITAANQDHNILALTSDSRGSASLTPFATQWSGTFRLGWLIDSFHALL